MGQARPAASATNALVLYKFNESANGAWTTMADDKAGARHWTDANLSLYPAIRGFGAVPSNYSRYFPGDANIIITRAGDASSTTAWLGEWTVQCFVYIPAALPNAAAILGYGAVGETEATNFLGLCGIGTDGKLTNFWEHLTGTNDNVTQTAGVGVSTGVETHVCWKKYLSGGQYFMDCIIAGTVQQTIGPLTNATGGTSAGWILGSSVFSGTNAQPPRLSVRSLKFTNSALSLATIQANAALVSTTRMHTTDAADFAHWKFIEAPDVIDSGSLGYHARELGSRPTKVDAISDDSPGSGLGARQFLGTAANRYVTAEQPHLDLAPYLTSNDYTITLRYAPPQGFPSTARNIFCYGTTAAGETLATNMLFWCRVSTANVLTYGWEHSSGTDVTNTLTLDRWEGTYRLAFVVSGTTLKMYVDGVLHTTATGLTRAAGGTSSWLQIGAGTDAESDAVMDDFVIYNYALTEGELITGSGGAPTTPSSPLSVTAVRSGTQVTVSWNAPSSSGTSSVTGYKVHRMPGAVVTDVGLTTSLVVSGLTPGTYYTWSVLAYSSIGDGALSDPTTPVVLGVPTLPTSITATPGTNKITVAWSTPSSNGDSAITGYKVDRNPGGVTTLGVVTSYDDTTAVLDTKYTYVVRAFNANGDGDLGDATDPTELGVPSAPQSFTATAGANQIALSWSAPASNGGSAVTGYKVTRSPGTTTDVGLVTSYNSSVSLGTSYTFTIRAYNANGDGALTTATTPTAILTPTAPLNVVATPGVAQVDLNWNTPASPGTSAITGYRITRYPDGTTQTIGVTTSLNIPGLSDRTLYTFTVAAINANGTGPESVPSDPVMPPNDTLAPVVTLVEPTEETPLMRYQQIVVDVTDNYELSRVILGAEFGSGRWELIHNGESFAPNYESASQRLTISGGYRFRIARVEGWPEPPTIKVFAPDTFNHEAEE